MSNALSNICILELRYIRKKYYYYYYYYYYYPAQGFVTVRQCIPYRDTA